MIFGVAHLVSGQHSDGFMLHDSHANIMFVFAHIVSGQQSGGLMLHDSHANIMCVCVCLLIL